MKKYLLLLISLSTYASYGQKDYTYIDHTTRSNYFNAIHTTDSIIYYSPKQSDFFYQNSTFNSIDSLGNIEEFQVFFGDSECILIPYADDRIKGFYFSLFEGDFGQPGFIEIDVSPDTIIRKVHDIDLYFDFGGPQDVGFETTENGGYIILMDDKLSFYDGLDQLLSQIDVESSIRSTLHRNRDGIFLVNDTEVFKIENQNLLSIYISPQNISQTLSIYNEESLHLITTDTIVSLNTTTGEVEYINYDSNDIQKFYYNHNSTFITHNDNSINQWISYIDSSGNKENIYSIQNDEIFSDMRLIENELYHNGIYVTELTSSALFKKTSIDNSNIEADCIDLELRYADIVHIEKSFHFEVPTPIGPDTVWKYVYRYDLAIENKSTSVVLHTDVYSKTFPVSGFVTNSSLHFEIEDIQPLQIKIISGELTYFTSEGIIRPEVLFIPGANHLLDCDFSNNSIDVSSIVSSTIGLKPIKNITLYPNPTQDFLNLTRKTKRKKYQILDAQSRSIQHGVINGKIDVNNLHPGVYFLKVDNSSLRFIKE